ncbi:protein SOSEKI 3-like isoform X2 [Salvia hispanica]|uniref:protein SOSEKI 3-like isoform X2 n=1 Tax=Salvia hispanica TaxID=49212 RepID=UPI0020092D9D|nr:protein SOSEKI 3-like isoform X2 [Salvia hispanica]
MDERMKKYRQLSPDRAKVWTEKSPKYRYNHHYSSSPPRHAGKVPVVYYLCRNRQLEHPHFMEVPLSSDDLYLRDVIERLNVLRGRGIGSMYSWSCKRSYRNGYVWHDLCEDDVIHPAHGNEYILKGSEIFEDSDPGRFSPAPTFMIQGQRALSGPPCPQNQEESSSSSSLNDGTTKSLQDDELPPQLQPPCASPESGVEKVSSWNGPLSLTEYKNEGIANASTQTELQECAVVEKGVSTDDGSLEPHQTQPSEIQDNAERSGNSVSPPPSAACAASSGIGEKTLESLIRDDVRKLNSFRILEEEGYRFPSRTKLKILNMITQLISCGYVQEKDRSFGLIPTYGPRYSSSKYLSTSVTLGEIDHLPENNQPMGKRVADKKCFSGSLAEKSVVEAVAPTLKRSSSYNSDRSQHIDSINDKEEDSSTHSKCVPLSIKASSLSKQLRCELLRSPLYEKRRISSERGESSRINDPGMLSESKRTTDPRSVRIEERLASGARVIIQSTASWD